MKQLNFIFAALSFVSAVLLFVISTIILLNGFVFNGATHVDLGALVPFDIIFFIAIFIFKDETEHAYKEWKDWENEHINID